MDGNTCSGVSAHTPSLGIVSFLVRNAFLGWIWLWTDQMAAFMFFASTFFDSWINLIQGDSCHGTNRSHENHLQADFWILCQMQLGRELSDSPCMRTAPLSFGHKCWACWRYCSLVKNGDCSAQVFFAALDIYKHSPACQIAHVAFFCSNWSTDMFCCCCCCLQKNGTISKTTFLYPLGVQIKLKRMETEL